MTRKADTPFTEAIDHDLLMKELLRTFFMQFLNLFLPGMAAYIEPDSIEFLDKELSSVARAARQIVDLLVKVRFKSQPACFLIHLEAQSSRDNDFLQRMFEYFADLFLRFRLRIYPIALLTYDQPKNAEPDTFKMSFPGLEVLRFRFKKIQLNQLNWRKFLRQSNPVACALMTRMKIAPAQRHQAKLECLRMLATLKLNPEQARLISVFVESYLKLNAEQEQKYQRVLQQMAPTEKEAVMELTNSWILEGERKGRVEGERKGRVEGELSLVLRLLRRVLGSLEPKLETQIRSLQLEKIEELSDALLDFKSSEDLSQWLQARK